MPNDGTGCVWNDAGVGHGGFLRYSVQRMGFLQAETAVSRLKNTKQPTYMPTNRIASDIKQSFPIYEPLPRYIDIGFIYKPTIASATTTENTPTK